jgi:hypothetical protein
MGSGAASSSAIPKIIGVLLTIGLLRAIAGHRSRHGAPDGWRDRRREAIAKLHRQLHEEEAQATPPSAAAGDAPVSA